MENDALEVTVTLAPLTMSRVVFESLRFIHMKILGIVLMHHDRIHDGGVELPGFMSRPQPTTSIRSSAHAPWFPRMPIKI